MKETLGRVFKKQDASDGSMTPFQAVCTALASTVGTGNIAGVAGAIAIGGPGAVFWMWISAILGMCTKFSEVTLAVHFRERNQEGIMLVVLCTISRMVLAKLAFSCCTILCFRSFNSIRNWKCYSGKYDHNSNQFCFVEFPRNQSVFCWNCESDHWYHCCNSCGIDLTWRNQKNRTGS